LKDSSFTTKSFQNESWLVGFDPKRFLSPLVEGGERDHGLMKIRGMMGDVNRKLVDGHMSDDWLYTHSMV
jgi:hypothetical protein